MRRCEVVLFSALIKKDGNWYVARCMDVDVTSQGKTVEEAKANLKEAIELYMESFGNDIAVMEAEQDIIYTRLDVAV
jgi:predicted RNase H-like HicB family nuclease